MQVAARPWLGEVTVHATVTSPVLCLGRFLRQRPRLPQTPHELNTRISKRSYIRYTHNLLVFESCPRFEPTTFGGEL